MIRRILNWLFPPVPAHAPVLFPSAPPIDRYPEEWDEIDFDDDDEDWHYAPEWYEDEENPHFAPDSRLYDATDTDDSEPAPWIEDL